MKKFLPLLLIAFMSISICACGSENTSAETNETIENETNVSEKTTKEDLLEIAVPYTLEDLEGAFNNKATATAFIGNVYSFEGEVISIEKDYAVVEFRIYTGEKEIKSWNSIDLCAHVYLSIEELTELKPNQIVGIAGKVSDVISTSTTAFGTTYEGSAIVLEGAITQQYYEITGTLKGKNHSYEGAWNIQIGDSSYLGLVYFAEGVDLSGFNEEHNAGSDGNAVTISTKRIDGNYHDATIIAVEETKESSTNERLLTFNYEDREFFKEYVTDLTPMTEDSISAVLNGNTFSMRNNFGSDNNGIHTITFHEDEGLYSENGAVFAAVRDWFLENYPDHKEMIVAAVPTRKPSLTSVPVEEVSGAAA